jgi:phage nucleotide-binding protein
MAIKLRSTIDVSTFGVKGLVYGQAGVGKTTLIKTMPNPVILSAEGGLRSLADTDIPYIQITDMDDLNEVYQWVESEEAAQYQSICLDSLSEIAEVVLHAEKAKAKDPRAAYGALQDTMAEMIRAFRDIANKHVLFTAKAEKIIDESGRVLYGPSMPGNKLSQSLPYFFDLVFALRVENDDEGVSHRAIMTDTDGLWQAKTRTTELNRLEFWEPADMGAIIEKLRGGNKQ